MKRLILYLSITLFAIIGVAQTTTVTYNTPFATTNQNLWQAGTGGLFQVDHVFFDMTWNESITFGPIVNIAGFDFGAELTAGTWGAMGAGFQINFGTEQVDISYNTDMNIVKPADLSFDVGEQVILNTSYAVQTPSASTITTDTYDVNMRLWLRFGMGIDLNLRLCAFSCSDIEIIDLDLPVDTFDIVSVSNITGISLLGGLYSWPVSEAFPFDYTDALDISTTHIEMPSNAGASIFLDGDDVLHSFVDPANPYFSVYFSIPKFIGALHIPYVSAFFANLSNSYTAGPFYLNYTLMEAGFRVGLYHKQHLTLDPTLKGTLDLVTAVDYQVVDETNGSILSSGYDTQIDYLVGNTIKIEYPCNYEFLEIVPSYDMDNSFRNHTYDSIALDFVFQMLSFDMGMNPLTVIPAFCVDIPYPCPTWSNPFRWCSTHVCTPAVGFGGFDVSFGPLVDWQPNLFNIKYNWCDNNWEMEGFNSFPNMASFRLEPRKFYVELAVNDVLCHGEASGDATATVTNGTAPYTYEWSNGETIVSTQSTNTQVDLIAGTHYVMVTDANDCMVFASEFIYEPEAPLSLEFEINEPLCHNSNDGNIQVYVSGGTPIYSYSWDNGCTIDYNGNLDAGTYTVTVTDNNGCTLVETFELLKPELLTSLVTSNSVNCFGDATGWANIEVNGGISPYDYNWSNGNTSPSDDNLLAGTYIITVTDMNNCVITDTAYIYQPTQALGFTHTSTDVDCYGAATGSITVNAFGGTTPYSYTWYNSDFQILNETNSQLLDIVAGDYQCIIQDSLYCSETLSVTITQPDSLNYLFTTQEVACNGGSDGEISLSLSGGTLPYFYNWSNGATGDNPTGLTAGEYFVTITDGNNCIYVLSTYVNEPAEAINIRTIPTDVLCFGESTGSITSIVTGGTSPYLFLWSNGASTQDIENLSVGTYTLTVTDDNDCIAYSGAVVGEPEMAMFATEVITPISCYGVNDGAINLEIGGGTIPYSLLWDDNSYLLSANQQFIDSLFAGEYNFQLVDANNCIEYLNYIVPSPDSLFLELFPTIVSCYEGSDGEITSSVTGGMNPYSYLWNTGSTDESLTNIVSDIYTLTVTDINGCEYQAQTNVESYPEIITAYEITEVSCKDVNDASISVAVTGGTGNYYYSWSNGSTNQNIDELSPGVYSLIISDDNNCEIILDFEIAYSYAECLRIPSSFSPNADGINDTWIISNITAYPDASIQIFNHWGNLLFESKGAYTPWDGTFNGTQLPSATYYYIIILNNEEEPYTGPITILR